MHKIVYGILIIAVVIVVILAIIKYNTCKNTSLSNVVSNLDDDEKFSYPFGFSTWGSYGQPGVNDAIRLYGSVGPGTPLQGYNTPIPSPFGIESYINSPSYYSPAYFVTSVYPAPLPPGYDNPFLWRNPNSLYYWENVAPYLNKPCYSSSKDDDCVPGYYKTKYRNKHTHFDKTQLESPHHHDDKHKSSIEWKCCRY